MKHGSTADIEDIRIATHMEIARQRMPGGALKLYPQVDVVIEDAAGPGRSLLVKPKMGSGMGRGVRAILHKDPK